MEMTEESIAPAHKLPWGDNFPSVLFVDCIDETRQKINGNDCFLCSFAVIHTTRIQVSVRQQFGLVSGLIESVLK